MRYQSSKNSDKIPNPKNSEDYINIDNNEIQIINKAKYFSEKKDIKNNHKNELESINYKIGEVSKSIIDLEEYREKKDILNESKNNS